MITFKYELFNEGFVLRKCLFFFRSIFSPCGNFSVAPYYVIHVPVSSYLDYSSTHLGNDDVRIYATDDKTNLECTLRTYSSEKFTPH